VHAAAAHLKIDEVFVAHRLALEGQTIKGVDVAGKDLSDAGFKIAEGFKLGPVSPDLVRSGEQTAPHFQNPDPSSTASPASRKFLDTRRPQKMERSERRVVESLLASER
jgi:hypothetical protein